MAGYDDVKVFCAVMHTKVDLEMSVEIKIRRAPHELFLKKGVPYQFSCSWEIFKNQTAGWEDITKKQSIVHKI